MKVKKKPINAKAVTHSDIALVMWAANPWKLCIILFHNLQNAFYYVNNVLYDFYRINLVTVFVSP